MTDRRAIYTDPDSGFPFEISSESELFGQGGIEERPSKGADVGDLFILVDRSATQLQRWNGSAWESIASPPGGAAGGDLLGTYPNPTINLAALPAAQFGANFETQEFTDQVTTTSATFQTYAKVTIPAGTLAESGLYRVGALWEFTASSGNTRVESRLLINTGTSKTTNDQQENTGRTVVVGAYDYFKGSLNTQDIDVSVQYRRVSGSGSAAMNYARFELWRVQ